MAFDSPEQRAIEDALPPMAVRVLRALQIADGPLRGTQVRRRTGFGDTETVGWLFYLRDAGVVEYDSLKGLWSPAPVDLANPLTARWDAQAQIVFDYLLIVGPASISDLSHVLKIPWTHTRFLLFRLYRDSGCVGFAGNYERVEWEARLNSPCAEAAAS